MKKLSSEQRLTAWFAFAFVFLAYMSIKLSVPALPLLQDKFHVSPIYLKLSASVFLVCMSASQLFWGGVAKFMPRRHVIYISIVIAMCGTLLAAVSVNVSMFILARAIEGVGVGVASPICRVMLADSMSRDQIARVAVFFGVIFNLAPFIAPTTGQYIIIYSDWRMIFVVFFILLLSYLIWMKFKFPETFVPHGVRFNLTNIKNNYLSVLTNRYFWLYVLGMMLFPGLKIAYYMAIPYWYMVHFHAPEHFYTFLALWTAIPNLLAYYFARFVIVKYGTTKTLIGAYLFAALAIPLVIILALLGQPKISYFISPLIILAISTGFIQPSVNAGLLSRLREHSSAVGALIPVMPFLLSALLFLAFTNISLDSLWPFAYIVIGTTLVGLLLAGLLACMKNKD